MKKILLLLTYLLSTHVAWANEAVEVDGIYYLLDNYNNAAIVTYKGGSYESKEKYDGDIVIPESISVNGKTYPVTSIDGFRDCTGMTSITIPETVTDIFMCCFWNCTGLTSITIPESVTNLGSGSFYGCTGLTSINIPNSVTRLDDMCFQNCTSLTSIKIPEFVTHLGNACFLGCTGLTFITIPESVTHLGSSCFEGCTGLTSITIPNSVNTLPMFFLANCTGLTSVSIPNSITSFGEECFEYCSGLISLHLGVETPPSLDYHCFRGCNALTTIYVPKGASSNYNIYPWNQYTIVEEETLGLNNLIDQGNAPTINNYYDITGRRINTKQCGVNIVRYTDGTTHKIMAK